MFTELKKYPNWVAWQSVRNEKKERPDKIPFDPRTGERARANDPATWGGYDAAVNLAVRRGLSGVGFELGNSPYAVIDLDHVVEADGTLKGYAAEIVEAINSYTEFSPSGTGLHIWLMLDKPLKEYGGMNKNAELGIEIYDTGRYITVTDKPYGVVKPIVNASERIEKIVARYFIKKTEERPQYSDIFELMLSSKSGDKIRALLGGSWEWGYKSQSEADLALCCHLAFWTGNNAAEIDRLFRQSGLMRQKWDEMRGGHTYGEMTVRRAIELTDNVYTPPEVHERTTAEEDFEVLPCKTQLDYVESGKLIEDIRAFAASSGRKTGFENMDSVTLHSGLYVIGAISSLGKTTFCNQMTDNLARAGVHVLYFSLEQSVMEITTKSLARLCAKPEFELLADIGINKPELQNYVGVSAMEMRRGLLDGKYKEAIKEYLAFADNIEVYQGGFGTTMKEISDRIKESALLSPVVFVDYLQAIKREDIRQGTKDFVDDCVREFKELSKDYNLTIFLICSFNRANYLTVVDFEAFKESGGIEYTADVVWGMQLACMNNSLFDADKHLKKKREFVRSEKTRSPRTIELKTLKNRYGGIAENYYFHYYPECEFFQPIYGDAARLEINSRFASFESAFKSEEEGGKAKRAL